MKNKSITLFFFLICNIAFSQNNINIEVWDYDTSYVKITEVLYQVKFTLRLENHSDGNYVVYLNDYPNIYRSYTVINHKLHGFYKEYANKKKYLTTLHYYSKGKLMVIYELKKGKIIGLRKPKPSNDLEVSYLIEYDIAPFPYKKE